MAGTLTFEFEWLGDGPWSDAERATFADLTIRVAASLATEVEDVHARTVRPSVRVSAYPMAVWLAANWWRLRWEPRWEPPRQSLSWQLSHNVAAIGGGFVWPDLSFSSDGEFVLAEARRSDPSSGEPIRYLNAFMLPIRAVDFENATADFISAVMERIASLHVDGAELRELWSNVLQERADPELARWRKLEARLGYDPGEAAEELILALEEMAGSVGEQAMEEVACGSGDHAPEHLAQLWQDLRYEATPIEMPVERIDFGVQDVRRPAALPWERGELLAGRARTEWGLGSGPLCNETFSNLMGVPRDFLTAGDNTSMGPISAGFRDEQGRVSAVLDKRHPSSRRFSMARVLADQLIAPIEDRLLPVTDAGTARQKVQRAFAQEFLCPHEALMEFFGGVAPSSEGIEDAARYFDVSPMLITHKLINKGVLDRNELIGSMWA